MLTVSGAMLDWRPALECVRGRERCMNRSVATAAILGNLSSETTVLKVIFASGAASGGGREARRWREREGAEGFGSPCNLGLGPFFWWFRDTPIWFDFYQFDGAPAGVVRCRHVTSRNTYL